MPSSNVLFCGVAVFIIMCVMHTKIYAQINNGHYINKMRDHCHEKDLTYVYATFQYKET